MEPLHKRRTSFNGASILLLGAGGAARAILAGLSEEKGISRIYILSRDIQKALDLVSIGTKMGLTCIGTGIAEARNISPSCDLIINSTPLGINDEESIIDYEHINKNSIVYDIVYKPISTNLIENAKLAGARVIYGYEMLLEQGAKAFEIWTGHAAPREAMKKALLGGFGEPV
jgi:shikimate dehydrogenase